MRFAQPRCGATATGWCRFSLQVAQGQRSLVLELRGASGAALQLPLPARGSLIEFQGRRYAVSATPAEREVRLDVAPATVGLTSREK